MQESSTPASQDDQSDEQAEPIAAPVPPDDEMAADVSALREEHVSPSADEVDAAPVPEAEGEEVRAAQAEAEKGMPAGEQAQGQPEESDVPGEGQGFQAPDERAAPYAAPANETTGPEIVGQSAVDHGKSELAESQPAESQPQPPSTGTPDASESETTYPEYVPEDVPEDVAEWVPVEAVGAVGEEPHHLVAQTPVSPRDRSPAESSGEFARHVPVAAPAESSAGLQVPWTLRQTLIGAGLTLIPWLIFALGSQLLQRGMPQPAHPHRLPPTIDLIDAIVFFLLSSALEGVFLIAPLIYAMRTLPPEVSGASRWRSALRSLGLRLPEPVVAVRAGVLAIAVILGASVAYSSITQALHLPLKTNVDTLLQQAKYAPYTVIGTLLVAVLVAPFCEETFFRGFLFPGLARGMRLWVAVVLSAALFGLAHTDLGSFVVLFVIGVVLAVLRARTSSLWPGIAVHTLNNTIAFISILVLLHH